MESLSVATGAKTETADKMFKNWFETLKSLLKFYKEKLEKKNLLFRKNSL